MLRQPFLPIMQFKKIKSIHCSYNLGILRKTAGPLGPKHSNLTTELASVTKNPLCSSNYITVYKSAVIQTLNVFELIRDWLHFAAAATSCAGENVQDLIIRQPVPRVSSCCVARPMIWVGHHQSTSVSNQNNPFQMTSIGGAVHCMRTVYCVHKVNSRSSWCIYHIKRVLPMLQAGSMMHNLYKFH